MIEYKEGWKVKTDDLTPSQHGMTINKKKSLDYYERTMKKHAQISFFVSKADLYFAALLESDPTVSTYVPRPFKLSVGRQQYIPSFYVVKGGKKYVIDLSTNSKMNDSLKNSLTQFFSQYCMKFKLQCRKKILRKETLARNWLTIVSVLNQTENLETHNEEIKIISLLESNKRLILGEIVDPGNRLESFAMEAAIFRLLHRGLVRSNLADNTIDYGMEFSLCD